MLFFCSPVRSYPNSNYGLHFNGQGTHLLTIEAKEPALSLYDLKSQETTPLMRLTAPGFRAPHTYTLAEMGACLAGRDGKFIIGSCRETDRVYIWSTSPSPHHQHNDQVQPLVTLQHENCLQVRYNEFFCTLVSSCGPNLKVWAPFRLPESIFSGDVGDNSTSEQTDSEVSSTSDEDISNDEDGDGGSMDATYIPSNSGIWRVE